MRISELGCTMNQWENRKMSSAKENYVKDGIWVL